MKKVLILLVLGLFLAGCGTTNSETFKENDKTNGSGEGIVAGEMFPILLEKNPLVYTYQVKNQTEEEVTLKFTSSQRYDYSVTKKGEKEHMYLFSSVAMFMQVLGEETIKQGEDLEYEIDLNELGLEPGEYVLKAWMTTEEGNKFEVSKEFKVE